MTMTLDFAKRLMEDFFLLACYANERIPKSSTSEWTETEEYARRVFRSLCDEWAAEMGEPWEVIKE